MNFSNSTNNNLFSTSPSVPTFKNVPRGLFVYRKTLTKQGFQNFYSSDLDSKIIDFIIQGEFSFEDGFQMLCNLKQVNKNAYQKINEKIFEKLLKKHIPELHSFILENQETRIYPPSRDESSGELLNEMCAEICSVHNGRVFQLFCKRFSRSQKALCPQLNVDRLQIERLHTHRKSQLGIQKKHREELNTQICGQGDQDTNSFIQKAFLLKTSVVSPQKQTEMMREIFIKFRGKIPNFLQKYNHFRQYFQQDAGEKMEECLNLFKGNEKKINIVAVEKALECLILMDEASRDCVATWIKQDSEMSAEEKQMDFELGNLLALSFKTQLCFRLYHWTDYQRRNNLKALEKDKLLLEQEKEVFFEEHLLKIGIFRDLFLLNTINNSLKNAISLSLTTEKKEIDSNPLILKKVNAWIHQCSHETHTRIRKELFEKEINNDCIDLDSPKNHHSKHLKLFYDVTFVLIEEILDVFKYEKKPNDFISAFKRDFARN